MGEIKTNDLQEVKKPEMEGFTAIKPQEGTTVNDARDFCNDLFKSLDEETASSANQSDANESDSKNYTDVAPRFIYTINMSLENDVHPITGVPFERKVIKLPNNDKIEGVFPVFDSQFDAKISESLYLESDKKQFCECNKQLLRAIDTNPNLKEKFTEEQIEQIRDGIKDGTSPDGYVWNHDAEVGKIQLVDFDTHAKTGHTGGRYLWGGGSEYRS